MTNLRFTRNLKKYKCHNIFIILIGMEIKLNENTIVKVNGNKAEIIIDKVYKLTIFLDKNKVMTSYSNLTLTIEYDKFDIEKLARKIYSIVRTSHKFTILAIQKALLLLSKDQLYNEIMKKLKEVKENGNTELLLKVYDLLD